MNYLEISDVTSPLPALHLPGVVSTHQIETLRLLSCEQGIATRFPRLRHLIARSLNEYSPLPSTLQTVQLLFQHHDAAYVPFDWTMLQRLATLPLLKSLRVLFCDTTKELEEPASEFVADSLQRLTDFRLGFRARSGTIKAHYPWFDRQELFIKTLVRRICLFSANSKPNIFIEEGGAGMCVWF